VTTPRNPWLALSALVVGFFMILLDMTIVAVANPKIMQDLHTDMTKVIWVTSAYLLTYAVPLLVTGRLGDRFGPKNIYLIGLVVFTLASLWCGLSGSVEMLIAARAVQGLGAALLTPQTMAVITRTFPPDKRGAAMGLWGGVAGLATLVGPILGGVLVDQLGWNWIFYINVPVGVVAFVLALWLVPSLPMSLFRDRNFSLSGVAIAAMGAAVTSMMVPAYFYLEAVREYSPTKASLIFAPMAIVTGLTAPFIGQIADRAPSPNIPTVGFALFAASVFGFAVFMTPNSSIPVIIAIGAVAGLSNSCIWAPLASTATRNLPVQEAGAGAGVYNTTRQIGSALGGAVISALIANRMAAQHLRGGKFSEGASVGKLPEFILHPLSTALSQSMYLPAAILLTGAATTVLIAHANNTKPSDSTTADPTPANIGARQQTGTPPP